MTLAIDGYYTEGLYSLELATRLDAYHWVELGLGLGSAAIDGGGSVSDQSLFEGRVGVAHVRCWRPVCGGGRVALGYLRDHHTTEDSLVSDTPAMFAATSCSEMRGYSGASWSPAAPPSTCRSGCATATRPSSATRLTTRSASSACSPCT